MVEKNKITEYLKRATADILLIVIGVSIALAADSWLAERNEKIRTSHLLDALESEWTAELIRIDEYNAEANLAKTAMIRIINAHKDGPPSLTAAEAASLLEQAHRWHTFKPSDGALTTVLADGLQNIDDASLRLAVASWRTVLAKLVAEQAALRELGTLIGPSIETRIVQESGEAYSSEPADYSYHGQGMDTGEFVLLALADDEWIAYWRHLVGVLERYQMDLVSVREELEKNLMLLRAQTIN
jgi:hypothetical protein